VERKGGRYLEKWTLNNERRSDSWGRNCVIATPQPPQKQLRKKISVTQETRLTGLLASGYTAFGQNPDDTRHAYRSTFFENLGKEILPSSQYG